MKSCAVFKPQTDNAEQSSVSWKSSSSYLTSSDEDEPPPAEKPAEKKIDFSTVLGNFNENFDKEQNFGQKSDVLAKWDSDTETEQTTDPPVKFMPPNEVQAVPNLPQNDVKMPKIDEDEISKWSDTSDDDSLVLKQSKPKEAKKEESVEKLKEFYKKTGAAESVIEHGLMGSPLPAAGGQSEDESKWDSDTNPGRNGFGNYDIIKVTD